jgi:hypothetical protein
MKCPISFNTLRPQELRAALWRMHVAVQVAAGRTKTRDRKNRYEDFLRTESDRRMYLEMPCSKREEPARKTRASGLSQLKNELSSAYAKGNRRHVDFRRHQQGCRRYLRFGCRHRHRSFGSVRNRNGMAPDCSGQAENTFGAQSTSSVLSTTARAVDYTSEPGVDHKSAAAKNGDYRRTPAYRDCCAAAARRNVRHLNSSDDCRCYSEAARCAGRHHSRRSRNGQPRRGDPGGACVLIARAGSWDDSIRRILPARGPGRSYRAALPRCAGYSRDAPTDCCLSVSSAYAASFPSKMAAGLARIRADAHCYPSSNRACAASFPSRKAAGLARNPAAAGRFRLHRE